MLPSEPAKRGRPARGVLKEAVPATPRKGAAARCCSFKALGRACWERLWFVAPCFCARPPDLEFQIMKHGFIAGFAVLTLTLVLGCGDSSRSARPVPGSQTGSADDAKSGTEPALPPNQKGPNAEPRAPKPDGKPIRNVEADKPAEKPLSTEQKARWEKLREEAREVVRLSKEDNPKEDFYGTYYTVELVKTPDNSEWSLTTGTLHKTNVAPARTMGYSLNFETKRCVSEVEQIKRGGSTIHAVVLVDMFGGESPRPVKWWVGKDKGLQGKKDVTESEKAPNKELDESLRAYLRTLQENATAAPRK